MYCKYCGHQIDDDSTFCQFCGKMQVSNVKTTENKSVASQENAIKINGNISISNNESFFNRVISFSSKHRNVCGIYALWFLVNVILLICGSDKKGFFPRIFKDYQWWHEYTMPTTRAGYEKYSWNIEWKTANYGWVEFVIYIALIPILLYFGYLLYDKYKRYIQNRPISLNPTEGLRND